MVGRTSSLWNQFGQFCLQSLKPAAYSLYRGITGNVKRTRTQTPTHVLKNTSDWVLLNIKWEYKPLPLTANDLQWVLWKFSEQMYVLNNTPGRVFLHIKSVESELSFRWFTISFMETFRKCVLRNLSVSRHKTINSIR